jgi:DNA-binding transcriptional LysR family regulator
MDTRFLESFIAVADCGSVAEAARRLALTPAGVAQRIRALEGEIGARLVVRAGRTVRPTEAGSAILSRSRRLLEQARDLRSIATGDTLSGEIRLGAMQTALTGLVPDMLSRMTKAHPRIEVRIIREPSAALYRKLMNAEVDAVVTSEPSFAPPKSCDWRVLRDEPFVVMCPASVRGRDAHAILATEPFIRLDRSVFAGQRIDAYLRKHHIRPRELFELDGLEAIVVMVDRGLGVTLLPDWAPPWPEGLTIRKLALPDPTFRRRTVLMWNRGSPRLRLIQAFLHEAELAVGRARAPARKSRK